MYIRMYTTQEAISSSNTMRVHHLAQSLSQARWAQQGQLWRWAAILAVPRSSFSSRQRAAAVGGTRLLWRHGFNSMVTCLDKYLCHKCMALCTYFFAKEYHHSHVTMASTKTAALPCFALGVPASLPLSFRESRLPPRGSTKTCFWPEKWPKIMSKVSGSSKTVKSRGSNQQICSFLVDGRSWACQSLPSCWHFGGTLFQENFSKDLRLQARSQS